jgi:hypothetical protein
VIFWVLSIGHWALGIGHGALIILRVPASPCPRVSLTPTLRVRASVFQREAKATFPDSLSQGSVFCFHLINFLTCSYKKWGKLPDFFHIFPPENFQLYFNFYDKEGSQLYKQLVVREDTVCLHINGVILLASLNLSITNILRFTHLSTMNFLSSPSKYIHYPLVTLLSIFALSTNSTS